MPSLSRRVQNKVKRLYYQSMVKQYTLAIEGHQLKFATDTLSSNSWFYPRYAGNRLHEPAVTRVLLAHFKDASCFLDIGANLGYFTVLATAFLPPGSQIYAFEMDEINFIELQKNIVLNNATDQVSAFHNAVSDTNETITYVKSTISSMAPTTSMVAAEGEVMHLSVGSITLNDFFRERSPLPDLVKMDVEGAELRVLQGMTNILPSIKVMLLEVHPELLEKQGHTAQAVFDLLGDFSLFEVKDLRSADQTHVNLSPIEDIPHENTMVYACRDEKCKTFA